jgi:hypothetical protein
MNAIQAELIIATIKRKWDGVLMKAVDGEDAQST